ncbi:hypothetical protein H0E84_13455 [Luteimonas sp. SJ-92]|uniref:Uncharacterized protein n=1 Tax=Luteimonas salinisoli TaxID=2752307 RepID=A0A853JF82_9GAMM|nr:hypothetical protein [Luteimonas salinisoli]NZA27392.1 hypothetical protein [Luteimonas salinisoli]
MSGFRDDAPPWSFFIPVTLAVIVGVLAANAIRYAVTTVLSDDPGGRSEEPRTRPAAERTEEAPQPAPAGETPADAATESAAQASGAMAENEPAGMAPPDVAQEPPGAGDGAAAGQPSGLQQLPGPLSARRDQVEAACINGTVTYRSGNGWEQALENDAPVRCIATSP